VEAGESITGCDNGHKDEALKIITCADPADGTARTAEQAWLDWWQKNKEKSQIEWIRDGLQMHGVSLQIPPTEADPEPLLTLLAKTDPDDSENMRDPVRYNAYRWLRDSGFDPLAFALKNVTPDTPTAVREGLLAYGRFDRRWPKEDAVGVLPLQPPGEPVLRMPRPLFFEPGFQITGYALMILPFLAGAGLLFHSRRDRKTESDGRTP